MFILRTNMKNMLISHNEDLQFMCPFLYVQNIRADCYKPDIKDLFTNVTYRMIEKCLRSNKGRYGFMPLLYIFSLHNFTALCRYCASDNSFGSCLLVRANVQQGGH